MVSSHLADYIHLKVNGLKASEKKVEPFFLLIMAKPDSILTKLNISKGNANSGKLHHGMLNRYPFMPEH